MRRNITLILLITFIYSSNFYDNHLLFCLNKTEDLLDLDKNGMLIQNNKQIEIARLFSSVSNTYYIEPWLLSASETDHSGDIYLNRIYRVIFNDISKIPLSLVKEQLITIPSIIHVEYDYIKKPYYTPNDVRYNQQWFLEAVQADLAWDIIGAPNIVPGDKEVLLASVDTGVDWNHTDLVNNIWQNLGEDADGDGRTIEYINGQWVFDPDDLNNIDDDNWDGNATTFVDDLIGWDTSGDGMGDDNNPAPSNTGSHGTHVAGLLAATTDNNLGISSVAFNSSIMSVKTTRDGGDYINDGYDGILYAAKAGYYGSERGFSIINCSWGCVSCYNTFDAATIEVAHNDYNAVIVAASGNGDGGEQYEAHYPSSYDYVLSVTALGENNRWNHWASYHESVDLGSPGEGIMSTTNQNGTNTNAYQSWNGTSMASPLAASCIGLLSALNPEWNNEQLETMIVATSDPIIYNVNTEDYLQGKLGAGRVDAARSLLTPLFPKIELVTTDYAIIGGNSDNIIDAGESLDLSVILSNHSEWGDAINPIISLTSNSNDIQVVNSNQSINNIASSDIYINDTNPFEVLISNNIPSGNYELEFAFSSNASPYSTNYEFIDNIVIAVNDGIISGDVNYDSTLNILDVVLLINMCLNIIDIDLTGDMNGDNGINILDVVILSNIILSLDSND